MTSIRKSRLNKAILRLLGAARALRRDRSGVAAIEFAMLAPVMLVAFFGTVEFCSAVAIDRKVTLIARTVSDLTSQASAQVSQGAQAPASVDANYLTNLFLASGLIIQPYQSTPVQAQVSEVYVDSTGNATIQWVQAATINGNSVSLTASASAPLSTRQPKDNVTSIVPTALLVKQTYLIFSEVGYQYVPAVAWGMMATTGIGLKDVSYTRPRQSTCIIYNNVPPNNTCPTT